MYQITMLQRTAVLLLDIVKDSFFAIRFINRHIGVALETTDCVGRLRALVQQLDQLAVNFVYFLSPISDVHGSSRNKNATRARCSCLRPEVFAIQTQTSVPRRPHD